MPASGKLRPRKASPWARLACRRLVGKQQVRIYRSFNHSPACTACPTARRRFQQESSVFVTASTECFPGLPLHDALQRLVDLEFTNVEIAISESGPGLKPSEVLADPDKAIAVRRETHRLKPIAYSVDIEAPGDEYYRQFTACCKLAQANGVVMITVPAAELGTPFNAEIERLREFVPHRRDRRRAGRRQDRGGPHHPGSRHRGRVVRQRQGARHYARPQPLHLRAA